MIDRHDELHNQRWIEIQFYYLIRDIMASYKDLIQTLDFIEAFAILGHITPNAIKRAALEMLQAYWMKPSNGETAVLAHANKVTQKKIANWTGLHKRTIYNILETEEKLERIYLPHFKPEELEEIKKFLNFFEKLRRLGV